MYLNNAFSKQPLEEAVHAMLPFLREQFENPLTDSEGAEHAGAAIRKARESVAALVRAQPEEICFVSSGTEANNWALKGAAQVRRGRSAHLVISSIEHFSVFQTALHLQKEGVEVTIVPVNGEGLVDPDDVAAAIRPDTVLVSILAGSDEIGVMQDLAALSVLKQRHPLVYFHTDAVQYLCYEELDTRLLAFDLISLSSNALYGPAGIAALFIRQGTRLAPLLHGGMQEEGRRPGLQSMALVAGFGAAAEVNIRKKAQWRHNLLEWRAEMFTCFDRLLIPVTGSRSRRLVDNVHGIVDVDGEALLTLLSEEGIRASTGSTCYPYAQKQSHVLKALGLSGEQSRGSILFTASADQDHACGSRLAACLEESLQGLRALKPW